jgi:hypothetical protein
MLIPDRYFTINLAKKSYNTRSYNDLTCKSTNVVFGLECNLQCMWTSICWTNKGEVKHTHVWSPIRNQEQPIS